jgi:hypothetical protein
MRRVAIIGTGDTIWSVGRDSLDVWEYVDHATKLEADEPPTILGRPVSGPVRCLAELCGASSISVIERPL